MKESFADTGYAFGYIAAVAVLGFHMHTGWTKAVHKMGLPSAYLKPVTTLLQLLIYPICLGFMAVPLFVWYGQRTEAGRNEL